MAKQLVFSFASVILTLAVLLGILEIGRRLTGDKVATHLYQVTQQNARFLFNPQSTITVKSPEITFVAHINKYGYRGADFDMPKPSGTLRIFAIGDSFTFGTGNQDNETIPHLLEQKLRAKGIPADVVNAGTGDCSPIVHYVNLRDIHLKYQPDLVLLFFDLTDLWDDWHWERSALFDQNGEPVKFDINFINGKRDWWRTCVYYSAACRFIHNKFVRTFQKIQALGLTEYVRTLLRGQKAKAAIAKSKQVTSEEVQTEHDGVMFLRGKEKQTLIHKHWPRTTKYLLKIKDRLEKEGISYVIVMYPHGLYVGPDQWSKGRLAWGFPADTVTKDYLPFEMMEGFTRKNSIPFVNILPAFLAAPPKKYFYDFDGHLTPEGNQVLVQGLMADPVFQSVLQKRLHAFQENDPRVPKRSLCHFEPTGKILFFNTSRHHLLL